MQSSDICLQVLWSHSRAMFGVGAVGLPGIRTVEAPSLPKGIFSFYLLWFVWGRKLLTKLMYIAEEQGVAKLTLATWSTNSFP